MVRISKQAQRRKKCPKRCRPPSLKTGTMKANLPLGYKEHANAVEATGIPLSFIPKIK